MPRPFDVSHVAVSVASSADCASSSASIRAAASAGAASPPVAGSSVASEPVPATERTATSACLASASFTSLPSTFRDPGRSAASVSGDVAGSRRPAHFIVPLPSRTTPSSRPKALSGRTSRMPGPPATPDPGLVRHAVADQAVHHASADVQIVPPRRLRLRGHCERGNRRQEGRTMKMTRAPARRNKRATVGRLHAHDPGDPWIRVSVRPARYPGVTAVGQASSNSEPIRSGRPPCAGTSTGAGRRQRQRPVGPAPCPYRRCRNGIVIRSSPKSSKIPRFY